MFVPVADQLAITDAAALSNRASSWLRRGRIVEAEADLRTALVREPNSVPALFGLGALLEKTGRRSEAERKRGNLRPTP